jgi:3-oxoacyl-[acyl-carrier protein] reductase
MAINLTGRTVLVTGANGGFGETLARDFLSAGANLLLLGRNAAALEALAQQLRDSAQPEQRIEIVVADLAEPHQGAQALIESRSVVDILVNNAALQGPIGPLWSSDIVAWQLTLAVDLLAPVALMQALIPGMVARHWGRIVNISGGGATSARANFAAYAAAKTALVRVTETAAAELAGTGVTVNAIAPGVMNTSLLAAIRRAGATGAGAKESKVADEAATQVGPPGVEAAQLCVFLASENAAGVSGRLIAAQWDPWRDLEEHSPALQQSDIYTLRRILPKDRGQQWRGQG